MRLRPRVAFAAPLVVVLGCRRPIAEPLEEPEPRPVDAAIAVVASIDAALVVEPIDAPSVIDAAVIAVEPPLDPCHDPTARGTCNPPPPEEMCKRHPNWHGCPQAHTVNPPSLRITRVLKLDVVANDVLVTVNAGSDDGVTGESTGYLVTVRGVKVPSGDAALVRIRKHDSTWRLKLTVDAVKANPQLRIDLH